jgi:putative ABC transport system substrate-binding protein
VLTVLFTLVALTGCGTQGVRPGADAPRPVLPDHTPWPDLEPLPPPRPPLAVVLSAETPPYRSVADALGDGKWNHYVLDGSNDAAVLAALHEAGHRQAIAIGQQALMLLAKSGLEVAYCQVFNADAQPGGSQRGVAALPEFGAQLDSWRLRQPALKRIGVITGAAHGDVAQQLSLAAASRALLVAQATVQTDREFLYVFRRMVPDIDGFLLYPDTSILSPGAIREMLAYARKHGVWVLTYNRPVFDLGAALLVSADPAEVASQVLAVLHSGTAGPVELPLSRVIVETAHPVGEGE